MAKNIFISHVRDDLDIVDTIRYHFELWGIPEGHIFQSSYASKGPRIGAKLEDPLKKALAETNLFVLVYTFPEYNWGYCMWEAGVASDPLTEDTHIIVFQLGPISLSVFRPELTIKLTERSILKFISSFFREDGFFPRQPAFNPDISYSDIDYLARSFYKDVKEKVSSPERESSRWPYLQEMIQSHSVFGSPSPTESPYDIFVLMPFDEGLKPIFEDHIKKVASKCKVKVGRADDFFSTDSIIHEIWIGICNSKIIIADCTGRNPNVFYEIGIAHTLDKPTILISQSIDDVPFDLRHRRIIIYDFKPRGMIDFENTLRKTINDLLKKHSSF